MAGTGPASKKVSAAYAALIAKSGGELPLLMDTPPEELEGLTAPGLDSALFARAVRRMRCGQVAVTPGYDGEYGVIRALGNGESREKKTNVPARPAHQAAPLPPEPEAKPAAAFAPNEEQRAVIGFEGRHALIIAGPGSGKTATLAARIARLLQTGVPPASILAVTFTVKAAQELRERIARIVPANVKAGDVTAATFHSLCASILREQGAAKGIPADFKILSDQERETLLEEICASREKGGQGGRRLKAPGLGKYIESRKRFLLLPGEDAPRFGGPEMADLSRLAEELGIGPAKPEAERLYGLYRERLRDRGALDFDDLVAGTARLFSADPAMLNHWQNRFRRIFVDEYQDINFAQYALLRLLVPAEGENVPALWVIGDPNQAIYGFRGSDKRFIGRFAADYPDAAPFTLSRSFRCAAPIMGAADRLMDTSLQGTGGEVSLFRSPSPTEKSEAEGIARRIARIMGGTSFFSLDSGVADSADAAAEPADPDDCAVLVRSLALAEPVVKALEDHGIPFVLTGDKSRTTDAPEITRHGVRLMTIHASKGLEFAHVFVPALEEGLLPFTLYDDWEDPAFTERVEEEKRLLYVAMTRARKGLYLSWAAKRFFQGRTLENPPSRFLANLEDLIPLHQGERRKRPQDPQLQLF
jgi:DNA helicase-2/ATP-dependent DNA helicase PcrA